MDQTTRTLPVRMHRAAGRALAAAALLAFGTAACDGRAPAPVAPVAALTTAGEPAMTVVKDPDLFCPFGCDAITAGDSMRYVVELTSEDGRTRWQERAKWASADERIATVSPTGMVTGHVPGEVEIRATIGTRTASAVVTIAAARIHHVALTAPATKTSPRGSIQLSAVAIDVQGNPVPSEPIFWFSATPSVVTVDQAGLVTGVGPGDGIVMAFAGFGRSAWVSLHVTGTSALPALAVASIDVGGTQACATGPSQAASCWGWNYYGQLGRGAPSDNFETFPWAAPVVGDLALAQVTAGDFHGCAIGTDGAPWCWGDASNGRLGEGSRGGIAPQPTRVATRQAMASIAAGGDHTCAVDTQGAAWCGGFNGYAQLGTGTLDEATVPARVASDVRFALVLPSLWHSCALATTGEAWCWGANDFGQLGTGRVTQTLTAVPARVKTNARFATLDSRSSHACGVTTAGETLCWGRNDQGQLGDGSFDAQARPVPVRTSVRFATVATGIHHTCALTAAGEAWCWGNNDWGQLGDNGLASSTTPVRVHGTTRFTSLTAGNNVTCGTTTAGEAWCWGSSHFGMLGNGQDGWDTISPVPVRVSVAKR